MRVSRGINGPPPEAWSKETPGTSTRPDTALLAVMEAEPGPAADLAAARAQLASETNEFKLLTLDPYKPSDHPYLDFNDEG